MSNFEDEDLEARLRRVASGTQPDPPARLHRRLHEIAAAEPGRTVMGVTVGARAACGPELARTESHRNARGRGGRYCRRDRAVGLLVAQRGGGPGATWAPRTDVGTGQWTALEWHDVTATAGGLANPVFVASGGFSMQREVARWQGGVAMMGGDYRIWSSRDGVTWSEAANSPWMAQPVPTPDGTALLAYSWGQGGSDPAMWRSTDGRSWERVAVPFGRGVALTASGVGDLAVATDTSTVPAGLSAIWFTADGATWTRDELPSDLAAAQNLVVSPFATGFAAVGLVEDPNGSDSFCDDKGNCTRYSYRAWRSIDGRTWSSYGPTIPPTGMNSNSLPWPGVRSGTVGMTDGSIYSTDDGVTWQAESEVGYSAGKVRVDAAGLVSDGARVIGAAGSITHLYLTEGDGRWTELRQGGDVGSLPSTGQLAMVPGGVLWITADRVYYGQALSGIEPRGSLGPPITPSPGPSLATAGILSTSSPAAVPTSTPTPTTPAAAPALTTTGLLTGWTGFSWAGGQAAGGNSIGKVIRWRGGYAAIDTTSNPGRALWTSPDGEIWTRVTALPPYWYELAASPAGLVVIVVDYGARSAPDQTFPTPAPYSATVWTSSDGVTWQDFGSPDVPCLLSIAGTSAGIVATVAQPASTGQCGGPDGVEFSSDGLHWTPEVVEPAVAWQAAPLVESDGNRFFLMGETTVALARSGDPAEFVLTSSMSRSYAWWSDDGVTWTRSGGTVGGNGSRIDFGRDGMIMTVDYSGFAPGGVGIAVSADGGKTWTPDSNFGPLGAVSCSGECSSAADGVIGGNGTYLVAVKTGGKQAWLSYDGVTWTPIAWSGGDPSSSSANGFGGFTVLPRGVLLTGVYGAAH